MTEIQELHDEILGLEAQLCGKRVELAMAQGEGGTEECFFDAAGEEWVKRAEK